MNRKLIWTGLGIIMLCLIVWVVVLGLKTDLDPNTLGICGLCGMGQVFGAILIAGSDLK